MLRVPTPHPPEAILEKETALLGAEHLDTLASGANLGAALAALGQHARALALHRQTLDGRSAVRRQREENTSGKAPRVRVSGPLYLRYLRKTPGGRS